jgi:hypothetical protein
VFGPRGRCSRIDWPHWPRVTGSQVHNKLGSDKNIAMRRNIGGLEFDFVGTLIVKKDSAGRIVEYTHQLPPNLKPNRHAAGPFCTLVLPEASAAAGLYALTVAEEVKYIGEAEDLARRFGPTGYGQIARRNAHNDGQSTNCKINSRVLQIYKGSRSVSVWFAAAGRDRKAIESKLVAQLTPPWNGFQLGSSATNRPLAADAFLTDLAVGRNRFEEAISVAIADAARSGRTSLRVRSGDLHRAIGGYPGPSHQMPSCCRAMKAAMAPGDRVIESPPKGTGANLVIEYRLPRTVGV